MCISFAAEVLQCILSFQVVVKIFRSEVSLFFRLKKFFLYCLTIHLAHFSSCFASIIFQFPDFFIASIDSFHSILIIICFWQEKGRYNYISFYIPLKYSFFWSESHLLCQIYLIIRSFKFFEYNLILITIISFIYGNNKLCRVGKILRKIPR